MARRGLEYTPRKRACIIALHQQGLTIRDIEARGYGKKKCHMQCVMVWGCFSYHGAGRLWVVPKGTTVNAVRYKEIFQARLLPSVRDMFPGQGDQYIFQDDGAPCHRDHQELADRKQHHFHD